MQYKIPQNVRREDKIVGPLTLKQLVIAGAGGGIGYAIWVGFAPYTGNAIALVVASLIWILTIALIFLKINGIVFSKWVILMGEHWANPRKRTYMLGAADTYSATIFKKSAAKKEDKAGVSQGMSDQEKLKNLSEITKVLDSYGKPPKVQ